MVINYEWNGIKDYQDDAMKSIKKYGFATKYSHNDDGENFYECIIPDEEQGYLYCTLSVEEVRDKVDEHPEIPIKEDDVDKTEIGELLYLLDLYCDIYDLFELEDAERFEYDNIYFDSSIPEDSIDSEAFSMKKRYNNLSMTKEKAERALKTINRYRLNNPSSYYNNIKLFGGWKSLSKIERSQLTYCKRLLSSCGETVNSFMKKVKRDSGRIYWLKDGEYIELK
jgi:hypothetical protein